MAFAASGRAGPCWLRSRLTLKFTCAGPQAVASRFCPGCWLHRSFCCANAVTLRHRNTIAAFILSLPQPNYPLIWTQGTRVWSSAKRNGGKSFSLLPPRSFHYILSLCVETALLDGKRHAIDSQHICSNSIVHIVRVGIAHHIVKTGAQD